MANHSSWGVKAIETASGHRLAVFTSWGAESFDMAVMEGPGVLYSATGGRHASTVATRAQRFRRSASAAVRPGVLHLHAAH